MFVLWCCLFIFVLDRCLFLGQEVHGEHTQGPTHTHLDVVVVLQTELSVSIHTVPVLCFDLQQQNTSYHSGVDFSLHRTEAAGGPGLVNMEGINQRGDEEADSDGANSSAAQRTEEDELTLLPGEELRAFMFFRSFGSGGSKKTHRKKLLGTSCRWRL